MEHRDPLQRLNAERHLHWRVSRVLEGLLSKRRQNRRRLCVTGVVGIRKRLSTKASECRRGPSWPNDTSGERHLVPVDTSCYGRDRGRCGKGGGLGGCSRSRSGDCGRAGCFCGRSRQWCGTEHGELASPARRSVDTLRHRCGLGASRHRDRTAGTFLDARERRRQRDRGRGVGRALRTTVRQPIGDQPRIRLRKEEGRVSLESGRRPSHADEASGHLRLLRRSIRRRLEARKDVGHARYLGLDLERRSVGDEPARSASTEVCIGCRRAVPRGVDATACRRKAHAAAGDLRYERTSPACQGLLRGGSHSRRLPSRPRPKPHSGFASASHVQFPGVLARYGTCLRPPLAAASARRSVDDWKQRRGKDTQ
jgi:hypothetical protein